MKILLHPGFHNTGTASIHAALRANRAALRPHLRVRLRPRLPALCAAARAWSVNRDPLDAGLIRYETAQLVETWDRSDSRPFLLSAADLAGHMPGQRGVATYAAAPLILQMIAETLTEMLPGLDLKVHFTTRAADPWLDRCYAHHVSVTRLDQDAETFREANAGSADFRPVIEAVRHAVSPYGVTQSARENHTGDPLAPLLDQLAIPNALRETLTRPDPPQTAPSDEKISALLALNRSDLDTKAWKSAKRALNKGTW